MESFNYRDVSESASLADYHLSLAQAYARQMAYLQGKTAVIDWKDCMLVEVVPGKVSGVPILKGTRLPADTILENYDGGSPIAEIAENFDISEPTIRTILDCAADKRKPAQP